MTQRVSIQEAGGKYGRLSFFPLFTAKEWSALREPAMSSMGHEIVDLIDDLPRIDKNTRMGWWLPGNFQAKPCESTLPEEVDCTPTGMGWLAALDLRKHQKIVISFLDAFADQNAIGRRRREVVGYNKQYYKDNPAGGIKMPNPFEGVGGIKRMLEEGAIIDVETPDEFLEVQCAVIYSTTADAYLTQQSMWKSLNRARLFVSSKEAENYIQQNKLNDCMAAGVSTKVESFARPDRLGPKAASAMSYRAAQTLDASTPEIEAGPKPARRM